MVIDFFIGLLIKLANSFPSAPTGLVKSFDSVLGLFDKINYYMPIDDIFICLGLYVVLLQWKLAVGVVKFILKGLLYSD